MKLVVQQSIMILKDMAFQNNNDNIKRVGETFLGNLRLVNNGEGARFIYLVIASSLWGIGKTRFAYEFLPQWKILLERNPEYRKQLEEKYAKELKQLENSMLVNVNLNGKYKVNFIMEQNFNMAIVDAVCATFPSVIRPPDEEILRISFKCHEWIRRVLQDTPIFLAIDELGNFVSQMPKNENATVNQDLANVYHVWNSMIFPLQCTRGISVYVSGKGAYLDLVGKGRFQPKIQLPSKTVSMLHHPFKKKDIIGVIEETPRLKQLKEHLQKNQALFDYLLDRVLDETSGVPLLVKYCVYDAADELCKCNNEKEIDQCVEKYVNEIPEQVKYPWKSFENQPGMLRLYKALLGLSLLDVSINLEDAIPISSFSISEQKEFKGFTTITVHDLSAMLNCYIDIVDKHRVKLIFPRPTREAFLELIQDPLLPFFQSISKSWSRIISSGDLLEHMTSVILRLRMNDGAAKGIKMGEAFPFLKGTCLDNLPCVKLEEEIYHTKTKVMVKGAEQKWVDLLPSIPENRIAIFYDHSHGPDKLIKFTGTNNVMCIQDKNTELSFNTLKEEVEKVKKMLVLNKHLNIVLLFFCRGITNIALGNGKIIYNEGEKIKSGTTKGIKQGADKNISSEEVIVPDRMSLVFVSNDVMEQFLGKSNMEAIKKLDIFRKEQRLLTALDLFF